MNGLTIELDGCIRLYLGLDGRRWVVRVCGSLVAAPIPCFGQALRLAHFCRNPARPLP
jgi:hypothetical protein